MQNKRNITIERIIAKIDNDFNPDNSDWIPRVAAWAIDAMSILKVLRTERKRKKIKVIDRVACCVGDIAKEDIVVYDCNGCKIDYANSCMSCCNNPSTGDCSAVGMTPATVDIVNNCNNATAPDKTIFQEINSPYPARYNVHNYYANKNCNKNYVIAGGNKIELNFDTNFIYIEQDEVVTEPSDIYGCDLPVIPNNGLLIEAIVSWCMYKMLCRGYKHTMFNLSTNNPAINPYFSWMQLKDKASTSLILDNQGKVIEDNMLWQSAFYIDTFDPKRKK